MPIGPDGRFQGVYNERAHHSQLYMGRERNVFIEWHEHQRGCLQRSHDAAHTGESGCQGHRYGNIRGRFRHGYSSTTITARAGSCCGACRGSESGCRNPAAFHCNRRWRCCNTLTWEVNGNPGGSASVRIDQRGRHIYRSTSLLLRAVRRCSYGNQRRQFRHGKRDNLFLEQFSHWKLRLFVRRRRWVGFFCR